MAYLKGSLGINPWRDIPLLRQIQYSTIVSHSQLFLFMSLGHYELRRDSFNWRLRRLIHHALVQKHSVSSVCQELLYTITPSGTACLEHHGDFYLPMPPANHKELDAWSVLHHLELNDIHLTLLRSEFFCNWIPESRLLCLINLGASPYAKAYDAVVEVRYGKRQLRFALEYEHTQKNMTRYLEIRNATESEQNVSLILYLFPSPNLMANVAQHLSGSSGRIYFALVSDFKKSLLDTWVSDNGRFSTLKLSQVLAIG